MKTIMQQVDVYTFEELNYNSQQRACQAYRERNNFDFLTECLKQDLIDELEVRGIKMRHEKDSPRLFYSLSYCQGDGVSFSGEFKIKIDNKDYWLSVSEPRGHYVHCNSSIHLVTCEGEEGQEITPDNSKKIAKIWFEQFYAPICRKLERMGYDYIDHEDSIEHIADEFSLNGAVFNVHGKEIGRQDGGKIDLW